MKIDGNAVPKEQVVARLAKEAEEHGRSTSPSARARKEELDQYLRDVFQSGETTLGGLIQDAEREEQTYRRYRDINDNVGTGAMVIGAVAGLGTIGLALFGLSGPFVQTVAGIAAAGIGGMFLSLKLVDDLLHDSRWYAADRGKWLDNMKNQVEWEADHPLKSA